MRPSNPFVAFARTDIEQSIPARFEYQVACHGQRVAIAAGESVTTYQELDDDSNRIAHTIIKIRGDDPEPVALLLDQGGTAIRAILGVLKTGKFYVPLDPGYPNHRNTRMLEACGAALILTDHRRLDLARDLAGNDATVLNLNDLDPNLPRNRLSLNITPDALAYIFFTSGSTGEPKGVFDTHRNVLHNVLRYTNSLHIDSEDRLTLIQACSFSGTVSSLFAALLNGARILPFDLQTNTPSALADWLMQQRATIYHSVPAIFRTLMAASNQRFDSIRAVRLEGDQATTTDVALYQSRFAPDCILINGFGTTETGLVSQYFVAAEFTGNGDLLPVGYAVEDIEVLVLNEGRPVPPEGVGEIGVRSEFLARGYWQQPDLTRNRFVELDGRRTYLTGDLGRMRGDGCVEHLGRMDTRIKIRGQAVELAEVEAALRSIDQVAEAAVVVLDDEAGQSELVAYIVVNDEPEPTVSKLRRLLAKTLAPYAIPARYVTLEALPLSAAGKLDRRALPQPQKSRPALDNSFARNYGLVQLRLVQIWEDLLQLEPVGITDDFFDLGGHSLLAVQMMDQIQREFGQRLSPTLLVSGATIGHLSQALARQTRAPQMVALQAEGSRPPFYFLHGDYISGGVYCRHLVQHLNQEQPLFAISPYGLDGDAVPPTYQEMARQHLEAIRAHRPNGPYRLGGVCNGGLIALEIARLLREHGESVECLLLIQASAANLRFANLWRRVDRLAGLFGAVPESRDTLFWRLRRLALVLEALPVQKRLIFFLSKIPKVPVRLLEFLGGRKGVEPAVDSGATNLETIFHHIDEIYIPSRYPHPVTLIWGSDELEPPEEAAKYWRRLGADVELHILPGLHTDALTKHVEQLAIQIQAFLDG